MAHDQADSAELQLTHEVPAPILGADPSAATLAAGVLENRSHPLRLKTRTVILLLVLQKGPTFQDPMEVSIDSSSGQVTVRYTDDGNQKVATDRLQLPPDLATA